MKKTNTQKTTLLCQHFKAIVLMLLFACGFIPGYAQYVWEEVAIPDSVSAGSLCFFEDDIYMATGNGVYHSNDNCDTWEFIGIEKYPIWSIYISSTDELYAGASSHLYNYLGVNTWDLLYSPVYASNILSIYKSDSNSTFFGNWGGIYRSKDNDTTWEQVLTLSNAAKVNEITSNSNGILFAGVTSYAGSIDTGGVFISTNGGLSWELQGLKNHFVTSIVIDSDDVIYAGTFGHWDTGIGGVYKSEDNGLNWEKLTGNYSINEITINKWGEVAFCCAIEGLPNGGIHLSSDKGITWQNITGNLPGNYLNKVCFSTDNKLYAIGLYGDLFRTATIVDINNIQSVNAFSVYPNPANDYIKIYSDLFTAEKIEIYSTTGRRMLTYENTTIQNTITVDIKLLNTGIYYLKIITNKNTETFTLIINH